MNSTSINLQTKYSESTTYIVGQIKLLVPADFDQYVFFLKCVLLILKEMVYNTFIYETCWLQKVNQF